MPGKTTRLFRPVRNGRELFPTQEASDHLMIRPIGSPRCAWTYTRNMRLPRSGPPAGALGNQLSALHRRRQLHQQQEDLQAGLVDYQAIPPYPIRPRPPS